MRVVALAERTTWDKVEEQLEHAKKAHSTARTLAETCHQLAQAAQADDEDARRVEKQAQERLAHWNHYMSQAAALVESIDHLDKKRDGFVAQARAIQRQIRAAHTQADQARHAGDPIRAALLVEKAAHVEREGQHRIDLLVRQAAEADARLDRERERLGQLEREAEQALAAAQG